MAKVAPPPPEDVQDGFDKNISLTSNNPFPGPQEDPYRTLRQVVVWLNTYYTPTLLALGMLGNLLSLIVFVATYLRRLSLSVYLAALALTDSAYLLALLVQWLDFAGWRLFHTQGWCQLVTYLSYVTSFLSAWLVVSFTVERYIAIVHPLQRPHMCTTRRAKAVVTGLSLFGLLAYSCSIWTSGIVVTRRRHQICSALGGYKQIYVVLACADFVVTLLVPFIAIFAFNVRIAVKIASFYNKKETAHALAMLGRASSVRLGNRAQVKVTKLLLIISTVFLVVNLPSYVMRVRTFVQSFSNSSGKTRPRINPLDPYLHQIFHHIFYLNFSINFLIYSVCSKQFRRALKRLGWQIKYKVTKLSTRLTSRGTYWGDGNGPDMRNLKDVALKHRITDPREGVL